MKWGKRQLKPLTAGCFFSLHVAIKFVPDCCYLFVTKAKKCQICSVRLIFTANLTQKCMIIISRVDSEWSMLMFNQLSHSSAKSRKRVWFILIWPCTACRQMIKNVIPTALINCLFFFFFKAIIWAAGIHPSWNLCTSLLEIRATITVCLLWSLWKMKMRQLPQLSTLRFVIYHCSCISDKDEGLEKLEKSGSE